MATADRNDIVIVVTNMPDSGAAMRLAELLIGERCAACVNILAECTSVYRWEGALTKATEVPLLIKTTTANYSKIEDRIRANHPYALPEILSIPVAAGLPAYLEWVRTESAA